MADITSLPTNFFGKMETLAVTDPKLVGGLETDSLIIKLSQGILYPDGTAPTTLPFTIVIIDTTTSYPEEIYVQAGELSSDGKTITLSSTAQRGINASMDSSGGIDFLSGSSDRAYAHSDNSKVRISISPLFWAAMQQVQQGLISSGGTSWKVGRDIDEDITWTVSNGDANPPYFKYISDDNKFVVSADGVTEIDMASGGVTSAGDGLDITSSVISIDLAATNDLLKITGGELDTNLTASKTELDQLAGTTNIAEADTFFGATDATGANMETLTDGSDADALHTHDGLVVVANGGTFSRTAGGAATSVIAHGLGKIPKQITFHAGASQDIFSHGSYSNSSNRCAYTASTAWINDTSNCIHVGSATRTTGQVTAADDTNFTITWTDTSGGFDVDGIWDTAS